MFLWSSKATARKWLCLAILTILLCGCISTGQRALIAEQSRLMRDYLYAGQVFLTTDPRMPIEGKVAASVVAQRLLTIQGEVDEW